MTVKTIEIHQPDDLAWCVEDANLDDLKSLLANPYKWVETRVDRTEGTLADHFIILFDSLRPGDKKDLTVFGIKGTGVISVRVPVGFSPQPALLASVNKRVLDYELHLTVSSNRVFAHTEIGTDKEAIADFLVAAALDPDEHCVRLSRLTQFMNGERLDERQKMVFQPRKGTETYGGDPERRVQLLYTGTRAWMEDPTALACNIDEGSICGPTVCIDQITGKAYPRE